MANRNSETMTKVNFILNMTKYSEQVNGGNCIQFRSIRYGSYDLSKIMTKIAEDLAYKYG